MPHRPVETLRAERGVRLAEQAVEPAEVPVAIGAQRRLQLGRIPPPRR
jgi:hypothetical protein